MNDIIGIDKIKTKIENNNMLKSIIISLSLVLLSILIMSVTFVFSTAVFDSALFKSYFSGKWLLLMNFIPIFLFMLLMYLIWNRLWAAYSATSLIFVTMSLVNKFKLMYRDDPFTFIDIRLVRESLIMAKSYSLRPGSRVIILIVGLILVAVVLKLFFKFKIISPKIRISLLIALILMSTLIFNGFYFNPKIYNEVGDKTLINIWVQSDQFKSKGFVYPFIYSITYAKEVELEGYNEKKAEKDLFKYDHKAIPENERVNIIAIMLESYNDFSEFNGVDLGIDIYQNFHEIQKESIQGKLVTNIFAGDTIKTERAFITGFYNHPKYYKTTNSFAWYFKKQGYKTEAMHPITGSFYNRRNVNEYLGFDSFEHYDNKYKFKEKSNLEDWHFFDSIIEGYENNKAENKPYFHFSVTYQNHGPYSNERLTEEEYLKNKNHYDEGTYNMVNNYFAGINQTDKALKKIIDYFRNEEEPTIIIIFGDHNPWLGKDHVGYDMMNIDLDLSTVEGFKNYYQTPYIIWGNSGAKKMFNKDFIGEGNTISPNFLMPELFHYLGWEGNEYMQYLLNVKEKFDVMHNLYFKENGEFKSELSQENKKLWEEFLNVEHYYSQNFKE
ncbi:MAG: LTA synthase family protein [Gottschalkiaceae bacterium]|nr:MAG: LTA synthase family protein [Gottschalkiaceae bacterium]